MTTLRIHLFGTFKLLDGNTPVLTVNTIRLQTLLAFLLIHRDAPQPRQRIAYLFWPDSSDSQARTNLRNLIHLMRHALPQWDTLVHAEPQTLEWRADKFSCDVVDFERALESQEWEHAIALYNGDFLPDSYDDWALAERERLRQMFLRALEALIARHQTHHDYQSAIQWAELLLRHEPLQEEVWRELMTLYARLGDRIAVRRVYDSCANVLRRELDELPSASTRELYERLSSDELPVSRPQIATPRAHNMLTQLTSFVGREHDMAQIQDLFLRARLVTLVGVGGCGKSRLAMQLATNLVAHYPDGVWWVDLAPLTDGKLIARTTLTALGLGEQAGCPPETTLGEHLQSKNLLLLFDNCEHLVSAVAQLITPLLLMCPRLCVLVTSREALRVTGETIWNVPPLDEHESMKLFVERSMAVLPNFTLSMTGVPTVAHICNRLAGIPLAIELAAARMPMLSLTQIAMRLDDCFDLLTSDNRVVLPRHQTLRATMEWSYALLSSAEQTVFRRLATFAASFTLDAVEAMCDGDALNLLSSLVTKSLVETYERGDQVRFRLLEMVRQYASEKLDETNQADDARDRHLAFYLRRAEEIEPELRGAHQIEWFDWIEKEHDNFRAALTWSDQSPHRAEKGLRLASALWWFWRAHNYLSEGYARLTRLLALTESLGDTSLRAKALNAAGFLALFSRDYHHARAWCERALRIAQKLANKREMAWATFVLGDPNIHALNESARSWRTESLTLWRDLGDEWGVALVLNSLGEDARREKNYADARVYYTESLAIREKRGDQRGIAIVSENLGYVAYHLDDLPRAREWFQRSLALRRQVGIVAGATEALTGMAGIAVAQNSSHSWRRAARILGAVEHLLESTCTPMMDEDRMEHEVILARLRARWGIEDFDEVMFERAWAEGRAMTLTQVIEYALNDQNLPGL